MKKILLSLILLATTFSLSAQMYYGAKAGVNMSSIGGDFDGSNKTSIYLGAFAEFGLYGKWTLQPELVYSRQGGTKVQGLWDVTYRINYLNVPVMFKHYITDAWSFEFGPQIGIRLNAQYCIDESGTKAKEVVSKEVTSFDIGACFGTSYEFMNQIGINFRYNQGLTNMCNDDDYSWRNSVMQLGVFYKF